MSAEKAILSEIRKHIKSLSKEISCTLAHGTMASHSGLMSNGLCVPSDSGVPCLIIAINGIETFTLFISDDKMVLNSVNSYFGTQVLISIHDNNLLNHIMSLLKQILADCGQAKHILKEIRNKYIIESI